MHQRLMLLVASLTLALSIAAQPTDTIAAVALADSTSVKPKENIIKRIIRYFSEANEPKRHKGLDFSIIGGPHYSNETKLGLGIVAAGQYYTAPEDTLTMMSNISLTGDITTSGFYKIGISGNHFTPSNLWRLDYDVDFYRFIRKFWGIGYERGSQYNDYDTFNEIFIQCVGDFYRHMGHHIYAGPMVRFTHARANKVNLPALWDGQSLSTYTTSVGLNFLYDTRDNLTAPERGVMVLLSQRFSPRFLFNKYAYSGTELTAAGYFKGWKGSVIGTRFHTEINYGHVPWAMMATFGGNDNMRGYYDGRFRDKGEWDLTVELRQHVWRRSGAVVWVGAGSVFDRPADMRWRHILPNAGVGYRWEFKKHTNVRLDFGIGRNETAFIFNLNEAF